MRRKERGGLPSLRLPTPTFPLRAPAPFWLSGQPAESKADSDALPYKAPGFVAPPRQAGIAYPRSLPPSRVASAAPEPPRPFRSLF